jgi:hypothetical protein
MKSQSAVMAITLLKVTFYYIHVEWENDQSEIKCVLYIMI